VTPKRLCVSSSQVTSGKANFIVGRRWRKTRTNVRVRDSNNRSRRYRMSMNSKEPLTQLPVLETDPLRVAQIGTVVWCGIGALSVIFHPQLVDLGITEAKQISIAGVLLGLIGQVFLTRRNRRLAQSQSQ
jgi:hypothetical protein